MKENKELEYLIQEKRNSLNSDRLDISFDIEEHKKKWLNILEHLNVVLDEKNHCFRNRGVFSIRLWDGIMYVLAKKQLHLQENKFKIFCEKLKLKVGDISRNTIHKDRPKKAIEMQ